MFFKKKYSFEKRRNEAEMLLKKYPSCIPTIVEQGSGTRSIDKHRFLVPAELTIGQFMFTIRNRIKLTQDQSLYLFINHKLPVISQLMSAVYKEHKDEDLFLYVTYSGENTFG